MCHQVGQTKVGFQIKKVTEVLFFLRALECFFFGRSYFFVIVDTEINDVLISVSHLKIESFIQF